MADAGGAMSPRAPWTVGSAGPGDSPHFPRCEARGSPRDSPFPSSLVTYFHRGGRGLGTHGRGHTGPPLDLAFSCSPPLTPTSHTSPSAHLARVCSPELVPCVCMCPRNHSLRERARHRIRDTAGLTATSKCSIKPLVYEECSGLGSALQGRVCTGLVCIPCPDLTHSRHLRWVCRTGEPTVRTVFGLGPHPPPTPSSGPGVPGPALCMSP